MLFQRKIDRLVNIKKSEDQFAEDMKNVKLEKTDMPAMIMAALLVFLPAILIVGAIFFGVIWIFFLR